VRRLIPLFVALLVAGTLAFVPAAPVPKAKPVLCFPVQVGTEWEYEWAGHQGVRNVTEVVTAVEHKGGVTFVTFGQKEKGGTIGCPYVMAVSGEGLHYGVVSGRSGDVPDYSFFNWELKLPAKDGDVWESDRNLGDSGKKTRYTFQGVEKVTVPAGEYEAYKVYSEHECKDGTWQKRTAWYAKGVGKVQWELDNGGRLVMKSFTPGKE